MGTLGDRIGRRRLLVIGALSLIRNMFHDPNQLAIVSVLVLRRAQRGAEAAREG